MQHTVWVFCAVNTKLQCILIIEGCVDSVRHKFYIFIVGAYTRIVRSSNNSGHALFWPQESKGRMNVLPSFYTCFTILARRNLLWTFSFEPSLFLNTGWKYRYRTYLMKVLVTTDNMHFSVLLVVTSFPFESESYCIFWGRYFHSEYYCDYKGMTLSYVSENYLIWLGFMI